MQLIINRTKGKNNKRTFFYPTINGLRVNNTNYARKYDVEGIIRRALYNMSKSELVARVEKSHGVLSLC